MIEQRIPHRALIVVADGGGAKFFRNSGNEMYIALTSEGELGPAHLTTEGPSGHRPIESSGQETDEATFAKQLAKELYARAHRDDFKALVLIADPQTLGQIRPLLHNEVVNRLILELAKTLRKATVADIQQALR